jgi:small-conductance mechanosensitive channel
MTQEAQTISDLIAEKAALREELNRAVARAAELHSALSRLCHRMTYMTDDLARYSALKDVRDRIRMQVDEAKAVLECR